MSRSRRSRDDETRSTRSRRRWLWSLGGVVVTLVLLGWFAPVIVAKTDLRQELLPRLLPKAKAEFSIGAASLNWLEPVELRDVVARDEHGEPVLTIAHISTSKPLWELARDSQKLGTVTITGLTWHATVEADGNNLDRAFGEALAADEDGSNQLIVELRDSRIELNDLVAQRNSTIEISQAQVGIAPGTNTPLAAQAQGRVVDESASGGLGIEFTQQQMEGDVVSSLRATAQDASLRPLACVLRELVCPCDVAGIARGELTVQWANNPAAGVTVAGPLVVDQLQFTSPSLLGQDIFYSASAKYVGSLQIAPTTFVCQDAFLELDHGHVQVSGAIPRSAIGSSLRDALQTLTNENVQAQGELDLAKLASALPQTLRIREDTTITGGRLSFNMQSHAPQGERNWHLRVASTNLTAEKLGQPVAWNDPIVIQVSASQTPHGPEINQLTCHCDFLQLGGRGGLNNADFSANANLTVLAQRLSDFIDLSDMALAGTADVNLRLRRQPNTNLVTVAGDGTLRNLQAVIPGSLAWREDLLQLGLEGELLIPPDLSTFGVQSTRVTLVSGNDQLTANTVRPASDLAAHDALPLHIEARGGVGSWASRLAWLLPVRGWTLQGDMTLTADAEISHDQIRLLKSQCDISKLIASGPDGYINEQQVQLGATGRWSPAEHRVDAKLFTLATTSWSLRGDDIVLIQPPNALATLNGQFALRSDLRRMLASIRPAQNGQDRSVRGIATGNIALASTGEVITMDVVSQIENLVVESPRANEPPGRYGVRPASATQSLPLWTERQLKLQGRFVFDRAKDHLQLENVRAESTGATATVSGALSSLSTAPYADITGEANYHLAALMHRANPALSQQIQMTGADTATFSLTGPLFAQRPVQSSNNANNAQGTAGNPPTGGISSDLQATANFGWDTATLYGLPIGEGQVNAQLRGGVVNVAPMSLAVSDGRLNLAPRFYINEQPTVMTLERGPLLQNVQLTPEMCRAWLKYVAPLLADATDCDGRISATVDRATIPLGESNVGSLAGTLTIHGADVRAGPLSMAYIGVIQRLRGALQGLPPEADTLGSPVRLVRLEEQTIDIHMTEQRVHHQGLTMQVGDAEIVTSGSVGVDQTLDLVAEIPVRDEWIEGRSYLLGLQGQTLKIPIRGSVSRPRVDFSLIEELGRKTLAGTASRALRGEINNLLGELLLPPNKRQTGNQSVEELIRNNPLFRNLNPPEMQSPDPQQPPPLTPPQVQFPGSNRQPNPPQP